MAMAWEWFQTSNLIQSCQIQSKENVNTNLPSIQSGEQKRKGRSQSKKFALLKMILNARQQLM